LRPAHVFAKPSADGELPIVALLHGPWRFALRLMMANSPTLTMLGRLQEVHAFFRAR